VSALEFGTNHVLALKQQHRLVEAKDAYLEASQADPKYVKPLVQRAVLIS